MIEVLFVSFIGPQIIVLLIVTVLSGLAIGVMAYSLSEIVIGVGVVMFIQFVLFWTSSHLDTVLYGFESGILNFSPGGYIALHHSVQLAVLWVSFSLGRAYAFRNGG
ncbi:hypothetical protein [Cognatishimia sp. MH4019]|uniref:hypothetical protein n=1 Tax=Cognatishimia sp. MH4019 TaxID=2854030 RepID=UPI001CD5E885|nr:hypothetical protein [Cognatishimia sp. MH4019]